MGHEIKCEMVEQTAKCPRGVAVWLLRCHARVPSFLFLIGAGCPTFHGDPPPSSEASEALTLGNVDHHTIVVNAPSPLIDQKHAIQLLYIYLNPYATNQDPSKALRRRS